MDSPSQNLNPETEAKIEQIIAGKDGYEVVDCTPMEQERYLNKYSFSALIFSIFYFQYMKDRAFFWLSIMSGVLFFPALFFLPFFARRRAWKQQEWQSFNQFMAVQKKWDIAAIYGTIIFALVFSAVAYYELRLISNFINSTGINDVGDVERLQKDLESSLGN